MVRVISRGLNGKLVILLNLIWHQLGFTKRHEVLNKNLSAYQNYKIINFYDGIIACKYITHNFLNYV